MMTDCINKITQLSNKLQTINDNCNALLNDEEKMKTRNVAIDENMGYTLRDELDACASMKASLTALIEYIKANQEMIMQADQAK